MIKQNCKLKQQREKDSQRQLLISIEQVGDSNQQMHVLQNLCGQFTGSQYLMEDCNASIECTMLKLLDLTSVFLFTGSLQNVIHIVPNEMGFVLNCD